MSATSEPLLKSNSEPISQIYIPSLGKWLELTGERVENGATKRYAMDVYPWGKTAGGLFAPVLVATDGRQQVRDTFAAKESQRQTLTPAVEAELTFTAACDGFLIINLGPGEIYVDIDSAAEVDGSDDILIPDDVSLFIPVAGTVVHVISDSAALVQCVGVR